MRTGEKVVSRDGRKVGETTGSESHCRLEGCGGVRLGVRWPRRGGRPLVTFPCTKGMKYEDGAWRIL